MAFLSAFYVKDYLDNLYETFDISYIHPDPLEFLHKFENPADKEIAGIIASCLAYGKVETIIKDIDIILSLMNYTPYSFTLSFNYMKDRRLFSRFKHRFTTGDDIACLIFLLNRIILKYGSIKNLFISCYNKDDESIKGSLIRFIDAVLGYGFRGQFNDDAVRKGVRYLLPSPADKSACKRLNLFLRWMVRRGDTLDTGLWREVCPSKLILPVDTHIARISQLIGLTEKKNISWDMAEEITLALKCFDPYDPVKYDFSLCRLGILRYCTKKFDKKRCSVCPIKKICING